MLKEIKYLVFFLVIILFFFSTINFYISDENKKKTFRNLSSIDEKINIYQTKIPIIIKDTDNIVKYLSKEDTLNKKKYSFWDLFKSEN
tara:strand:+ start:2155 stop:2418 length:264 start_codon:yes stop_codon:yes gene_type:complete